MYVTIVHIHVKTEYINDFIKVSRANHQASVKESGNRRFDVLQMANDPAHFVLYEAYDSAEEAAAHKKTEHYLHWRATVSDWMASVRTGVVYNSLYPA